MSVEKSDARLRREIRQQRLLHRTPNSIFRRTIGEELLDCYDHVNNMYSLLLGDMAVRNYAREIGIAVEDLGDVYEGIKPVKRAQGRIEWLRPIYEGDEVMVNTSFVSVGQSSFKVRQWIIRDEELVTDIGIVTFVMTKDEKPTLIPDDMRNKLIASRRRKVLPTT